MLTGTCHCGNVTWSFDGMPDSATACNCTLCRRYGVLWIYDYEGERIEYRGPTSVYTRAAEKSPALDFPTAPASSAGADSGSRPGGGASPSTCA